MKLIIEMKLYHTCIVVVNPCDPNLAYHPCMRPRLHLPSEPLPTVPSCLLSIAATYLVYQRSPHVSAPPSSMLDFGLRAATSSKLYATLAKYTVP